MKKVFQAKRKRLRMSTAASVNAVNQKIENIWKNQEKQRQKLCQQFSQDFLALFQEWTINAQKTKEEEEKLANLIVKQQKIFQESKAIQKRRLKQAHALYEEYLKNVDDLDDAQEYYFTDQHGAFQKEMDAFKEKILTECQKQDLAVVQASLQSILF
ncbi:synaptonemal complex protein 3-like [Erinaceus europaeus]|uniref:Synaptonemal complex protein 3-like n=1 Tax=Erinaceus europaeus TaxID=9365 RepID=A0ABM3WS65_ERIEU|nr:synaptonemal complex protein 3-like [Erinaceus europaeus]